MSGYFYGLISLWKTGRGDHGVNAIRLAFVQGASPHRHWALLLLSISCLFSNAFAQIAKSDVAKLPTRYAESVAVYGIAPNGTGEVRFRLARFPERGKATLWASVTVGGQHYSVVDDDIDLGPNLGATPVDERRAVFRVAEAENIAVGAINRHTYQMRGRVNARVLAQTSRHPSARSGDIPLNIRLDFQATQSGIRVRFGRLEIFGETTATITTPTGVFTIEGVGKWHEQTGQRLKFASPFSYLWGKNEDLSLLARGGPRPALGICCRKKRGYAGQQIAH